MTTSSPRVPSSKCGPIRRNARSSRRRSNILSDRPMNLPSQQAAAATGAKASNISRRLLASHPRALEIQQHLQAFPWDVTCLNLLTHRHEIFPDVLNGKSTTTRTVEYLVELKLLSKAMNGWLDVVSGRSQHYLGNGDKRFVLSSINNAYGELAAVLEELQIIGEKSYSSRIKEYSAEVHKSLTAIHENEEVRRILE